MPISVSHASGGGPTLVADNPAIITTNEDGFVITNEDGEVMFLEDE